MILPDAGHMIMLEHHDLVTDHLRDLVERAAAHSASTAGVTAVDDPAAVAPPRPRRGTSWPRRSAAASPAPSWSRAGHQVGARAGDQPGADVLLVGEAPGAQEDAAGVPFVGRSGQLLDSLLAEAGLDRATGRGRQRAQVPPAGATASPVAPRSRGAGPG